jgi:hypothetical protein
MKFLNMLAWGGTRAACCNLTVQGCFEAVLTRNGHGVSASANVPRPLGSSLISLRQTRRAHR